MTIQFSHIECVESIILIVHVNIPIKCLRASTLTCLTKYIRFITVVTYKDLTTPDFNFFNGMCDLFEQQIFE